MEGSMKRFLQLKDAVKIFPSDDDVVDVDK